MVLFVCLFVCTVTDFSAAEKDMGVKFCMHVRLLSTVSFSHFCELWLAGSHGGGITSGMYAATYWMYHAGGGSRRGSMGQSELGWRRWMVGFASCKPIALVCFLNALHVFLRDSARLHGRAVRCDKSPQ